MLRGLWAHAVTVVSTAICGTLAAAGSLFRPDFTMHMGRRWGAINLAAVGAQVRYEGLHDGIPRPCIYVANHQSNVDIYALIRVVPTTTRFVAKESLFRIPAIGWALRASDFIPIDRTNRAQAIRSLDRAAEKIRSGRSVILFAEGTRSAGDKLAPFKKGPFHLALKAGVPIVPVAISGSGAVLAPRTFRVTPGPVTVRFLDPVDVVPFTPDDVPGLMDAVRGSIAQALDDPVGA